MTYTENIYITLSREIYFILQVTITGAYLYDAVTVYAKALDKVLQMGGDPRNGTLLMSYVKGHPFTSNVTIHIYTFEF